MTSFPLYDSLCKDLDSEEITTKEQNKFMKLIENFDVTGYELLYILISIYHKQENIDEKSTFKLPYGGKFINNNDISFDFNEFPTDLKKILYKFSKIHIKKIKEEKQNESDKIYL